MNSIYTIFLLFGCLFTFLSDAQTTLVPGTEYFGFEGTHLVGKQEVLIKVEANGELRAITSTQFKTVTYTDHRLKRLSIQNDSTYVFENGMVIRRSGTWIYRDSSFRKDVSLHTPVADNKDMNYFRNNAFISLYYKQYTDSIMDLYAWKMVDFDGPYTPVYVWNWMMTLDRDMPYRELEKIVKDKLNAQLAYLLQNNYRVFRGCIKLEEEDGKEYKTALKIADEAALYGQLVSAEPFQGTDTTHYTRRLAFYDTFSHGTNYMYVSGNRIRVNNRVFILKKDVVL